ncbi:PleD family two-component system response regulator [Leptothoe kymatousa]|uniref:Response regulatory domain-containing protein n=1 Tax=Leptothoe kymatousa TAU-MAC 1615 TaxID=2364775 RepID=A0ABS5Y4A7_9CYAN|nr:hypothetical protein [Leptothoe kymatousa]MBT9312451.1 hypothetical protein [Leptothoe kymatousa TAU-MAC 1615]
MKAIAIVGGANQPETLLADLLHWHGLSVFQVESGETLLPLLSFISPELIIVESLPATEVQSVCDRIKRSAVVGRVPVLVCSDCGGSQSAEQADAYLCGSYTAEDVFAYIQALRPLGETMYSQLATSAWVDS